MNDALRPDGKPDLRRQTGFRVLFDKRTQQEAWLTARLLKRLTPQNVRYVRLLVESFLNEQAYEGAERGDTNETRH